jgi:hypothetical protein
MTIKEETQIQNESSIADLREYSFMPHVDEVQLELEHKATNALKESIETVKSVTIDITLPEAK